MSGLWTVLGKPLVVDLSHNNPEPVDFHQLYADGVRLVILKATQGSSYIDPTYARRRRAALAAGLKVEAYHFCDATEAKRQLDHLLAVAELDDTMRGALDAEPNKGSSITFQGADILADMLDQKRGVQGLRYTGAGFLTPAGIVRTPKFRQGPIWWAKYGPAPTQQQMLALGISPFNIVLWQETGSGSRPGVKGPVDESYFIQGPVQLARYPELQGFPLAKPAPEPAPSPQAKPA